MVLFRTLIWSTVNSMEELVPKDSVIDKYFFTPLYRPRSAWSVVAWWEARRPVYNAIVGATGLLTMTVAATLGQPPLMALLGVPIVYGLAANVCYSFGSVLDLILRRWLGPPADSVGPVLLRYGFVFSVGLTLLPIPLFVFGWVMSHIFR